jgi:hypothetical protein
MFVIRLLWTVFVGGLALIYFFIAMGNSHVEMTGPMFMLAIGFGPMALFVWGNRRDLAKFAAIHTKMLAAAGVAAGTGYDYGQWDSGIAINTTAKTLTMRLGEKWKTYPFSDIREWRASKHTASQVVAGNVTGALAALGPNIRASQDADAATGLFVTVRDIDNPQWRIAMHSEAMQARWMEILRQSINEGR